MAPRPVMGPPELTAGPQTSPSVTPPGSVDKIYQLNLMEQLWLDNVNTCLFCMHIFCMHMST